MGSGCQTDSQMDSVGIGEVRPSDDEWRRSPSTEELRGILSKPGESIPYLKGNNSSGDEMCLAGC